MMEYVNAEAQQVWHSLANFKTVVERYVDVGTSLTFAASSGGSSEDSVFIRGQGEGQGIVKMEENGRIVFAGGAPGSEEGERFLRDYELVDGVLVSSFKSEHYPDLYICGDTESFEVSGQMRRDDNVYWKMVRYSVISGNIQHFKANGGGIVYCLQYWGDSEYRNSRENGLFLAANGSGSEATFSLITYENLREERNGTFSFS